nr:hypothetical protein [Comamonas jiangduensis]
MGEREDVHTQVTRFKALDRVMALAEFDLDGRLLHANRTIASCSSWTRPRAWP